MEDKTYSDSTTVTVRHGETAGRKINGERSHLGEFTYFPSSSHTATMKVIEFQLSFKR